ncbi:hypothetical protein MMC10_003078 [Thelotrema lepadinum]|nr:hypothetical protein [Thelotrema lepadinum]
MAQFAAFLTMLGLAVDPFSQQVLRYVDCPQNVSSLTAVISRTNIYARAAEGIGESQAIIDDPMVVAINTGLVNPSQSMTPLVAVQCGSGNCTFPQFSTVGICHSCEDVSNQVIINYSNKGGISNATLPGSLLDDTPALWLGTDVLLNTSTKGWNQSSIMQLRVLSLPNPYEGLSGPKASAFRCTLSPCIKTYNALMTNSILNETLMSIETIGFNQLFGEGLVQDNAIAYRLAINRTLVNGQWENCHASTIPGPGLINVAAANIDASPTRPASQDQTFNESYYLQGCVWQFGYQTTLAIQQELTSVLNLQQMVLSEGVPDGGVIADTIWRNGLANLTSMNSLMQNLSDAMTASVRQRGDDGPSAWAQGQAMINSTCVDVRWVWLSYSAVLVGLVIVFQVLLVIQMPGDVVDKAWKSSSLPLLFFSVDDTLKQKVQYNQTKDDMVKLAEITSAQLVEGHKGAVFI